MATRTSTATGIELDEIERISVSPKAPRSSFEPGPSSSTPGRPLGSTPSPSPPVSVHAPATHAVEAPKLSVLKAWILLIQLCGNNFINCFSAGMLIVCFPVMAADLHLPPNLLLWPTSVTALASASSTLIAGSVSDALGARRMNTVGSLLQSLLIIACGAAGNGSQLIAFRALQGIASSAFDVSGRSMLSAGIERGRLRNFAFAFFFLCFPLGAGAGLVLGGIYADKANWRVGYYSSGALGLVFSITGIWTLPPNPRKHASARAAWRSLRTEVDWVGAVLASGGLTILSYVLAILSASTAYIHDATTIALLALGLALIPTFAVWMHHQERRQRPALIPNSLWKSRAFTSVCIMVAASNGTQSCLTYFISLFFQRIQLLSPFQASLRLLPQACIGMLMCLLVGTLLNTISPFHSVTFTMVLCSFAPLLMAVTHPAWPYWYTAFWAQVLAPLAIDVIFVIGALVVADAFEGGSQARGAAVFGMCSQIGASVGLCVMSVIANSVVDANDGGREGVGLQAAPPDVLLKAYRVGFWTMFASAVGCCVVGVVGLRKLEAVGKKRD